MTFSEFWPVYVRAHSRSGRRLVHLAGTLGGWMLVGAAIAERRWWWVLAALLLAYGLAWLAHFFVEHNMPATFEHPLFSWWADQRMVFLMLTGQMGREMNQYAKPASPPEPAHGMNRRERGTNRPFSPLAAPTPNPRS